MLEKDIEKLLIKEVKKLGGVSYKFISPGNIGVPDRIVILKGKVYFVELKTDSGKLTELQKRQIDKLNNADAVVNVIYGVGGLNKFLEVIKNAV